MTFETSTRYGYEETYDGDDANVDQIISELLDELEYEKFNEPDNEHTQVSLLHGRELKACLISA